MKEIQIDELRELQMQILDHVNAFCHKYGIKYTISGGTLLGAVRHGGYIPWDDDMDIQMLRREYNRFTELWNKDTSQHDHYELVNIESGNNMGYPFGKVHDTRTTTYIGRLERTGVYIDVFPVDKVRDEQDFNVRHSEIKELYKKRSVCFSLLRSRYEKTSLKQRVRQLFLNPHISYEDVAIKINNLAKINNEENCPFVFEMIAGMQCKKMIPKEVFEVYEEIKFENRRYMSVKDFDTYLERTFGDYMKLPPVEKQKSFHNFLAYWK